MGLILSLFSRFRKKKLKEVIKTNESTESRIKLLLSNLDILPKLDFSTMEDSLELIVHCSDVNDLAVLLKRMIIDVKLGQVQEIIKTIPSSKITVMDFFSDKKDIFEWIAYDRDKSESILNQYIDDYFKLLIKLDSDDLDYFIRRHGQALDDILELLIKLT